MPEKIKKYVCDNVKKVCYPIYGYSEDSLEQYYKSYMYNRYKVPVFRAFLWHNLNIDRDNNDFTLTIEPHGTYIDLPLQRLDTNLLDRLANSTYRECLAILGWSSNPTNYYKLYRMLANRHVLDQYYLRNAGVTYQLIAHNIYKYHYTPYLAQQLGVTVRVAKTLQYKWKIKSYTPTTNHRILIHNCYYREYAATKPKLASSVLREIHNKRLTNLPYDTTLIAAYHNRYPKDSIIYLAAAFNKMPKEFREDWEAIIKA